MTGVSVFYAFIAASFASLCFSIPFLHKLKKNLLYFVPVINALADVTVYYFPEDTLNSGHIRGGILVFLIIYLYRFVRHDRLNSLILGFLAYLLLLSVFTSNPATSIETFLKVSLSLMIFPVAREVIRSVDDFRKLNYYQFAAIFIIVLQLLLAQKFKAGMSAYVDDTFYMGGGLVQLSYPIVVGLIAGHVHLHLTRSRIHRYVAQITYLLALVMLVLILRRASIVAFAVGTLVYFTVYRRRISLLKYVFFIGVGLYFLFPYYRPTLLARYERRAQNELEEEARVIYTRAVLTEFVTGSIKHKLVGTELFNSESYFNVGRGLHTDYNVLLHGSGLLGLLFYLFIHWKILTVYYASRKATSLGRLSSLLDALVVTLMISSLLISFSGSLTSIGYRSLLFLYLGAAIGLAEHSLRSSLGNQGGTNVLA